MNPGWSLAEFSSPESTLRADFCSVSVPLPVLPQRHIKDPSLSAKSAGGRVHLNMHTPLTQRSQSELTLPLSRHSGNLSGNKLKLILSRNSRPQSSQSAEPLWTDPGIKSEISIRELIST